MNKGILLHEAKDDVGVAVVDLKQGEDVLAVTLEGKDVKTIHLAEDVPLGHKVAMQAMPAGHNVIEYGRPIGEALAEIAAGGHVHIHNIKSLRWAASQKNVFEK